MRWNKHIHPSSFPKTKNITCIFMLLSASFSAFHFSDFNFQHFTVTGLSAPPLKSGQIPAGSKHSVSLCAIKIRNQDFFASRDKRIDGGAMREEGREKGKWGQTSAGRWVRISNLRGRWTGKKSRFEDAAEPTHEGKTDLEKWQSGGRKMKTATFLLRRCNFTCPQNPN